MKSCEPKQQPSRIPIDYLEAREDGGARGQIINPCQQASTSKCDCFLIEVLVSAEILGEKEARGVEVRSVLHAVLLAAAIYASYLALIGK